MKVALLPLLLVTAFFTCSFAHTAHGQEILDKKLTLEMPARELKVVLKAISSEADVNFTYSNSTLPDKQKVAVSANNEKLGDVLTRLLQPLDISFEVIHEQIVLHRGKPLLRVSASEMFKMVSGTVTASDGTPIPGVSVVISGTTRGTVTNAKGYFEIQANEGETLLFSSVGFATAKMVVGSSGTMNVVLSSSVHSLDSVAITALGIQRSVRTLGYSQEAVKGAEIARSNAPNVINALAGKMAGVNVTSPNGVDGGTTRIIIGGNNTIQGDNQPLIIVDGMPLANGVPQPYNTHGTLGTGSVLYTNADASNTSAPKDWGSPINLINPEDIESMSVLKGPTAAALYGGKGANGVILITTKKGSARPGLGIDYSFGYKMMEPYRYLKMQNEYGSGGMVSLDPPQYLTDTDGKPMMSNDAWTGLFVDQKTGSGPYGQNTYDQVGWPGTGLSWGHKMDGTMIKWWDGTMRPDDPQPGNLKLLYRDGMQTRHNISVSGGNEWGTVRASYTRLDNTAILPNSDYNQNSFNVGANIKLSKRLNMQVNTSYFTNEYHNAPQLGNDDGSSWQKRLLYNVARDYKGEDIPIYKNADGSQNPLTGFPFVGNGGAIVWNMYENNSWMERRKLLGSVQLNYTATPFLDVMFRGGLDNNSNELTTKNKPTDILGLKGYYAHGLERDNASNFDFLATFHKENLLHKTLSAKFSAGGTIYQRDAYGDLGYNDTWAVPFLYSLKEGSYLGNPHPITESILQKKMNSVYGFLNLAYKDYLFLDVTGRNDWTSALPKGEWSYFFPSVSGSFVFTDAFHIDPSVLSFGKIRAAYAEAAVDPLPYQVNYTFATTTFAGQTATNLPGVLQAPNYKPATNKTADFGLVLGFWGNKLSLDMRYYHGRSDNQIVSSPLPISSGVSSVIVNTGVMENSGAELIVNARPIDTRNFKWSVALNLAHNSNRLLSLSEGTNKVDLGSVWNDGGGHGPTISVKVGDQFGTIYGYDHIYDKKTGLPLMIKDPFGNPAMNGTLYQSTDQPVPIGNATPKVIGGITNTFTFKGGISVSMLVDGKFGGEIWSGSYATMMQQGQAPETLKERDGGGLAYTTPNGTKTNWGVILPGVFEDGTVNTNVVHYYYKYMQYGVWSSTTVNGVKGTDWNDKISVLKDNWVKMREITVNYNLPDRIVRKTRIFQQASVSLVGRDLFYLYSSLPDHINPEGSNGAGNGQGLEFASLPSVRSMGFQVRVSF